MKPVGFVLSVGHYRSLFLRLSRLVPGVMGGIEKPRDRGNEPLKPFALEIGRRGFRRSGWRRFAQTHSDQPADQSSCDKSEDGQ
jgi:hypothetical protein